MSRKEDLEQAIRDSYKIIRGYELDIQVTNRHEEKLRAQRMIEDHKSLVEGYVGEYRGLVGGALPDKLAQIVEYVSALDVTTLFDPRILLSPEAIARHRAALRERLEREASDRWGGMSVYIQEEGAALPIEASPYQMGRLGPRENLLGTLREADRLMVLGDPGSGKTVALERLAWEMCSGNEPTVPVLVRLFRYAGTPLREWIRALLQETGHLRLDSDQVLTAFLKEGAVRCAFLFDGLNEVTPAYRDRLVDELARWMAAYPLHSVILTSRPQDELWRRLRGEVEDTVVVQVIDDAQARAYLVAQLGAEQGDALYDSLDERLRGLARIPLVLWLIKEAGAASESVPGNRGQLYARFVSRTLRRDTDRRMDVEIPERIKRQALTELAYHLSQQQRLSCRRDDAIEVVVHRLGEDQAEQVLGACLRHGLLAGEDEVWFSPHQTVQEYFAALALRDMADRERSLNWREHLLRRARRILTRREEGLAKLAEDDWWMESFVQLAGLVGDADWLAGEVTRVNPWLAWWCVTEGGEVRKEVREAVEYRSIRLLDSGRVADRRRAVETLATMQSDRVVQPLFRTVGDEDAEVSGLAMQTVLDAEETVRTLAREALEGTDPLSWRAALRCLVALPDDGLCQRVPWETMLGFPMVWVPSGPFLMGSDKAADPQALISQTPQHSVTLPGYWIGRYAVTVAQFRSFVEASEYEKVDLWAIGGDNHPVQGTAWYDAMTFCRWLTQETGLPVMLPSEAEWEKAARGTDGRIYPWGDEWDADRCNTAEGGAGETSAVGTYSPLGDSPYGCADMAGNVLEWTRNRGEMNRGTRDSSTRMILPMAGRT